MNWLLNKVKKKIFSSVLRLESHTEVRFSQQWNSKEAMKGRRLIRSNERAVKSFISKDLEIKRLSSHRISTSQFTISYLGLHLLFFTFMIFLKSKNDRGMFCEFSLSGKFLVTNYFIIIIFCFAVVVFTLVLFLFCFLIFFSSSSP